MSKRRVRKSTERRGKRVILYVRVSDTTGRENKMISPEVQANEAIAAARREGLVIVDTVIDLDKSGRSSDERKIAAIINRVEAKEADGVLVWKISRWGRNTMDSLLNIGELQEAGGYIVSATENLTDVDTPAGKFSLTVLLAIAQMFSDEIGRTWASIHDYRISLGKTGTKTWRMGYLRQRDIPEEERHLYEFPQGVDHIPDPVTGPWMTKAFEWHHSGVALVKVVDRLNAAGVRSRHGALLTHSTLRRTLDGGFHAGLIVDRRGEEEVFHPGKHTALVSEELFLAYRTKVALNVPHRNKNAQHRLTRLSFCASCERRMIPKWRQSPDTGVNVLRWACQLGQTHTNSRTICESPAITTNAQIEEVLLPWLMERAKGQDAVDSQRAAARKVGQLRENIEQIERDIQQQEKLLSVLVDKVLAGVFDEETFKNKQTEIRMIIARLEEDKVKATGRGAVILLPDMTVFEALVKGWHSLSAEVFNEALSKVVGRIDVHRSPKFRGRARIEVVGRWELEQPDA